MFALIFGGSGSGKSEYAEKLSCELAQKNEKYYIATMIPYGEEGKKRVERHKKLREGKDFYTIEQTMHISGALEKIHVTQQFLLSVCQILSQTKCLSREEILNQLLKNA